jgi:hypothetical protein
MIDCVQYKAVVFRPYTCLDTSRRLNQCAVLSRRHRAYLIGRLPPAKKSSNPSLDMGLLDNPRASAVTQVTR